MAFSYASTRRCACVAPCFVKGEPSEDCHELLRRRAVFSSGCSACLAKPVSTAGHTRFPAPVTKPITETPDRKRSSVFSIQIVRSPHGLASSTRCNSGKIGTSTVTGFRRLFYFCTNFSQPPRACWRPSCTTSERRTPVHISSASASRALLPIGWRASNCATSSTVQLW